MAVKNTPYDLVLQVRLDNGTTSTGKSAVKNVNFSNVKLTATDQQLYDAGTAAASLLSRSLLGIHKIDTRDLAAEE